MKFFIGFMAILALAVLFIDNASGQSPPIASGKFIILPLPPQTADAQKSHN